MLRKLNKYNMKDFLKVGNASVLFLLLFSFVACDWLKDVIPDKHDPSCATRSHSRGDKVTFYALANGLQLDELSTKYRGCVFNSVLLKGLQPDEKILDIDFRPATGQLYGLGSTSRIYVINPETGDARMVGAAPFTPALTGALAGFDFNPTVDRIRVVTDQGQNLRLNPETGAVYNRRCSRRLRQ
jgi:hypothetical protein